MADGRTHFIANVVSGTAMTLAAHRLLDDPQAWTYVALGSMIGAIITPDLDQEGRTHTENLLRRIPVVGFVFQVSWYPYAILFRHRGASHTLLFGTLSRVLYSILLILFWLIFASGLLWMFNASPQRLIAATLHALAQLASAYLVAAWFGQDVVHYIFDL